MVQLPLDIIYIIVTYFLPPLGWESRVKFILPLCYIHPDLLPLIQRLLYSHPSLHFTARFDLFMATVSAKGSNHAAMVKSFRMQNYADGERGGRLSRGPPLDLSGLAEACPQIEEIWLDVTRPVSLRDFALFRNLRNLFCDGIHLLLNDGPDVAFQSVENLFLAVSIEEGATCPFPSTAWPSLQRLSADVVPIIARRLGESLPPAQIFTSIISRMVAVPMAQGLADETRYPDYTRRSEAGEKQFAVVTIPRQPAAGIDLRSLSIVGNNEFSPTTGYAGTCGTY